ncbi:MAG: V-type ATP synthase subunit E, partial [Candidatus Bathyarchaeia archaeon]
MDYQANKTLIKKILSDAEEEAKSLINDGKIKAEEIMKNKVKEAEEKAKEEANLIIKEAEEKARRISESIITSAKIRANWNILSEKKKLIEETFARLGEELKGFTKTSEYTNFLLSLIEQGIVMAGGEELEVMLTKEDLNRISLKEISKEVSNKLGRKIKLTKSSSSIDAT